MEKDYQWVLFQLVSALKAKTTYLKSIDANSSHYNQSFYEGMATAYHLIMDEVKTTLIDGDLPLEQFNLHDYDPNEILKYKPMNFREENNGQLQP